MTIAETQKDNSSQISIIQKEAMAVDVIDPTMKQDVTDQQQEQRNLTSLNLHSSTISPIQITNLPANILEQLQQYHQNGTELITSIPSPHPVAGAASISPNNMIVNFNPPPPQQSPQPQAPQQSMQAVVPPPTSSATTTPPSITTSTTSTTTAITSTSTKKSSTNENKETKGLTADERRQRRLLRNRLAAKDCRRKKKEYIQSMQDTITRLETEKEALKSQIQDLKDKISKLPHEIPIDDNYKLMKEVTELNAKLGNMK